VPYTPAERLWFHDGITITRGHEGSNRGVDITEGLLDHKVCWPTGASTPDFGSKLFGSCFGPDYLGDNDKSQNPSGRHKYEGGAVWKL
jgi:hypothetical protein